MLALAVFAAVGLGLALRSLLLAFTLSTPVPVLDQWEFVGDLMRFEADDYSILDLFAQHNEHRIFTARLSFFLDYFAFHLDNLSVVLTNYGLMALLAGGLAAVAARGRSSLAGALAFVCALAALWSTAGWVNLGWAFQVQWAYVHLFPTLAMLFFALAARRSGGTAWSSLALACLCDFLASFSMASGLCTIFAVIAVAVWLRAPWRLLAAFGAWHVVVLALFLWGYDPPRQDLVLDPVRILRYVAPFLGTALPMSKRASILLGNAGLVLAAVAMAATTWTTLVAKRRVDAGLVVLIGVASFCSGGRDRERPSAGPAFPTRQGSRCGTERRRRCSGRRPRWRSGAGSRSAGTSGPPSAAPRSRSAASWRATSSATPRRNGDSGRPGSTTSDSP